MNPALVLSCEHASNRVPQGVALGVGSEVLDSHIGYDVFALDFAQALALRRGAPLFAGQVSRLVVDLNRHPLHPDLIPLRAFGMPVPGNGDLNEEGRARRLAAFYRPYRHGVRLACADAAAAHGAVLHLSVHSFTPVLYGQVREVEVGVLFDPAGDFERRCAEALLVALGDAGLDARANLPYAGVDDGLTTWLRGELGGDRYAGIELEIGQGLSPTARWRALDAVDGCLAGMA